MELSKKQNDIVTTNERRVVVVAAAASGKTRVMTERVKYLLEEGVDPTKIVFITYTNAAAAEIRERVGNPPGLFIGTVHSYANYLLISAGYNTFSLLDEERYDELFAMVSENMDCIQEVEHLLLDEAQDSDAKQMNFLLNEVNPESFMLCGDHRQCIYRFIGSKPDLLINIARRRDVTTYSLNENYRCGATILAFAKRLLKNNGEKYIDDSIAMCGSEGQVTEIPFSYGEVSRYAQIFQKRGSTFIICRSNAQVAEIEMVLKEKGLSHRVIRKSEFNSNEELKEALKSDEIKLMTIHASKGLEADYVIAIGAFYHNTEERCIAYVAATRAKKQLVWINPRSKSQKKSRTHNWE